MQPMASIALKAARKAGDFILRAMDRPDHLKVETKARNDFVSNVDKTSEQIILEQIRETFDEKGNNWQSTQEKHLSGLPNHQKEK